MKSDNGPLGERYAANYLRSKGYAILAVNFKTRFGFTFEASAAR